MVIESRDPPPRPGKKKALNPPCVDAFYKRMEEIERPKFEQWFKMNYAWFLDKENSKEKHTLYQLDRFRVGAEQYSQEIPAHDWRIWQAALFAQEFANDIPV